MAKVLTERQQRYRSNVLEALELIASREQQLQYQRDVPIAYVSAEMFCFWDESFNCEWLEDEAYRAPFSSKEIQAMKAFDEAFHKVNSTISKPLPELNKFILTPQWEELSQAANKALLSFQKNAL